jgi:hypothetical protein
MVSSEQRLRIEILSAVTPMCGELLAVVTMAEAIRRRRLNVRSSAVAPHDGGAQRAQFGTTPLEFAGGLPTRCWIDLWDAAATDTPSGFLGKIDLPLATTRLGVPHLIQRNLLHGGPMRVRLRLDAITASEPALQGLPD